MDELTTKAAVWLRSVLDRLPAQIRAVYVKYGDAYTPRMVHLVCFNAFGFESLADGRFDPSNRDHVGELGDFSWEPSNECSFRADDHPATDWVAVLTTAAQSSEVRAIASEHDIQLVVGEHDGDVFVIR
jgi:hypothetical protein